MKTCLMHQTSKVTVQWVIRISFSIKHLPLSKLELSQKQLHEFLLHILKQKAYKRWFLTRGIFYFYFETLTCPREGFHNGRLQSILQILSVCHYEIFPIRLMINSSFDKSLQTVYKNWGNLLIYILKVKSSPSLHN